MQTLIEFNPQPIMLESKDVRLKPLTSKDIEGFYYAANHEQIWRWMRPDPCGTLQETKNWIDKALVERELGNQVPFVIIDNHSQEIIGSSRYCSIRRDDRNIEISHTLYPPKKNFNAPM